MRPGLDAKNLKLLIRRGLQGPQMLAFLPAISLAAYWGGGEVLLVFCALLTPLVYALTGGFGQMSDGGRTDLEDTASVEEVAEDFLAMALHNGQTTACLQLRISGLDAISDAFGPTRADEARDVIETRLTSALRQSDHVFRSGDCQFTLLIAPGFRLKLDSLLDLAKRLRLAAEEPISINGVSQYVTVNIGIASSLNFGRNVTADIWLDSAIQALTDAVESGTPTTRVWSDKLSRRHKARRDLQDDIAGALDAGQIQAFFQPQVSVRTGDVTGMEALARWDHPTRGILPAAAFLPAAMETGQMVRLGQSVVIRALNALQTWDGAGLSVPTISVNLSEAELLDPDLPDHIAVALDRSGVLAHRLVLEISETVLRGSNDDISQRNLIALSEIGCAIDLDNFGTGTCGVSQLQSVPFQRLKIDRQLVMGSDLSEDRQRILSAIIGLADRLEMQTVGCGVETLGEHGVLRDLGCGHAQGFLFAEPGSAGDIGAWLAERQGREEPANGVRLRRVK
ncbi:bifunctional diguanylate cyclase/phosphodiesterase [uncultured Marivita sp.]|uniref:bifunctional diguanylate cyclase/phosphodiesterase n=1 Tax=uncultured Marivita sp. TaxID=888080 RepID=UPI0026223BC2|nr:bifunctional diguanylate cyclase/phosphodiesterase [uncultured Marivita sp.]